MEEKDFWDEMQGAFSGDSVLDLHLQGRELEGPATTSVRDLTDQFRSAHALPLPQPAGTRVKFVANLGSVLTYDDLPDPDVEGTVVLVKTAVGKTTALDDRVFILWDDGKFRPIFAEHLRLAGSSKKAASFRRVISNLGDISGIFAHVASGREDELVHKATNDLWSFHRDGDHYVIERLFNENGRPLKE